MRAYTSVGTLAEGTYLFKEVSGEAASLYGYLTKHLLLVGFLEYVLLHRTRADQSEDAQII